MTEPKNHFSVPPQPELLNELLSYYGALAEVARRANKGHGYVKRILRDGAPRRGQTILAAAIAVRAERRKEAELMTQLLSTASCMN